MEAEVSSVAGGELNQFGDEHGQCDGERPDRPSARTPHEDRGDTLCRARGEDGAANGAVGLQLGGVAREEQADEHGLGAEQRGVDEDGGAEQPDCSALEWAVHARFSFWKVIRQGAGSIDAGALDVEVGKCRIERPFLSLDFADLLKWSPSIGCATLR
jgi:hypothetical protein